MGELKDEQEGVSLGKGFKKEMRRGERDRRARFESCSIRSARAG